MNGKTYDTKGVIKSMPTYPTTKEQYMAYDRFMTETEAELTKMHDMVNTLYEAKKQVADVLKEVKDETLKAEGKKLLDALDAWDKDMVQRKSKAYDDVENFPNKFTAEYLFMINHSNSSIPRITQPALDRRVELDAQWAGLKAKGQSLLKEKIPAYNAMLWEKGIGAIRK
ncbi:hypothetical protein [Aureicoccus marinus]|uniref:hypothetical protein n=1 Tax=Aureicoccus marinus TaxID=754435 RepID=UPI0026B592F2|nr:hypothetical protein [Aureicoccus marinus]